MEAFRPRLNAYRPHLGCCFSPLHFCCVFSVRHPAHYIESSFIDYYDQILLWKRHSICLLTHSHSQPLEFFVVSWCNLFDEFAPAIRIL